MLSNYLKIAFRNMLKQKTYSFINILGLAIGMAVSLLIFLWVIDELSFNKFHENYDDIHLVFEKQYYSDQEVFAVTATPYPLAPALKEEYPEIINSTRVDYYTGQNTKFDVGENKFSEAIIFVDSDFTDMFTFNSVYGTLANSLDNLNSLILTESIAKKYFGDENPIGKVLKADSKYDFIVTAVVEDVSSNSSIRFEMLGSFKFLESIDFNLSNWGSNSVNTYVQLDKNTDAATLVKKIKDRVKEFQANIGTEIFLHPFSKQHLYSIEGSTRVGRIQNVIIFSLIALFILVIASINFINLTTARATKRFKEVGLKKVIGATRLQMARQFFGESILLSVISLLFAVVIVLLLLSEFNFITGKQISIAYLSAEFYLLIFGVTVFVGMVSGIYPALYLSKFTPVEILNEKGKGKASSTKLRSVLVVFQFSISVVLILATIVLFKQTDFMLKKDVGFNKEGIVYIKLGSEMREKIDAVKSQLSALTSVEKVSSALHLPALIGWNGGGYSWEGKPPAADPLVSVTYTDNNWWSLFDMQLKEGRGFADGIDNLESNKVMINETFAKMISPDGNVVGKTITRGGENHFTIIGVVKDFDFLHMRREVGPLSIFNFPNDQFLFVKINGRNQKEVLSQIENVIKNSVVEASPSITFMEEYLDKRFVNEEREKSLAGYFALLTILIASLGLFGLSAFIAEQKTKEIGIRKVLGASVQGIVSGLSLNFIKSILLANLIGLPLGYYLMTKWLEDYPYRIDITVELLSSVFLVSMVIALFATSYQSIKAAVSNPVKSLRYE